MEKENRFCDEDAFQAMHWVDRLDAGIDESDTAEVCKALRYWIDKAEAIAKVMPIETAPTDGTDILVWNGVWTRAAWNGNSWDDGNFYDHIDGVTHWMPMPVAPRD